MKLDSGNGMFHVVNLDSGNGAFHVVKLDLVMERSLL